MTKIIQLLLFTILSTTLLAQNETKNYSHEIGINLNAVLNQWVLKKERIDPSIPLEEHLDLLSYRHFFSDDNAFRVRLGFDNFSKIDTTVFSAGNFFIEKKKSTNVSFRIGIQDFFLQKERIKAFWGIDWIYRNHTNEINGEFILTGFIVPPEPTNFTQKENQFGIAIPIGFQYFFLKNLSISTELSIEMFGVFSKSKNEDSGVERDFEKDPQTVSLAFRPPLALFLNFYF